MPQDWCCLGSTRTQVQSLAWYSGLESRVVADLVANMACTSSLAQELRMSWGGQKKKKRKKTNLWLPKGKEQEE